MTRRRKIDSENVGERASTSLRLPVELLERIDNAWKSSDEYTGRTHFIEKACRYYLDCEKCPNCGNFNHKQSVICSMCETKLGTFNRLLKLIEEMLHTYDEIIEDISKFVRDYDDLFGKIRWLLDKLKVENKFSVGTIIEGTFVSTERGINKGRVFLKCYNIYSKYDNFPIPQPIELILSDQDDLCIPTSDSHYSLTCGDLLESCLTINYHYRICQLMVEDSLSLHFKDIDEAFRNLSNSMSPLLSFVNDVSTSYDTLESIEKLTTILLENQTPTSISITRRGQQD